MVYGTLPRMKTPLFLSSGLLLLFGCRADLTAPESLIEWDQVSNVTWEATRSTDTRLVPLGTVYYFAEDGSFRGYLPDDEAYCGSWDTGGNAAVLRSDENNEVFEFDVTQITADSLVGFVRSGNALANVVFESTTRPHVLFSEKAVREAPDDFSWTDSTGFVNRTDLADWRTNPNFVCALRFSAPYPNPAGPGQFVTIEFEVTPMGEDVSFRIVPTTQERALGPGIDVRRPGRYRMQFPADYLDTGALSRIYVYSNADIVTYGDIQVR